MNIDSPAKTPRIFPILLVLIAVPMILGGLQLIFLGGSFYYLLTGLLLVATWDRLPRFIREIMDRPEIPAEGFLIRQVRAGEKKHLVLTSGDDAGLLYGAYRLLRLVQTHQPLDGIDLLDAPKTKLRMLNHWDNLDRTVERGYAGFSIFNWHTLPELRDPRYADYARANASVGINATAVTNVNSNALVLTAPYIRKAKALADIFRPYGIRLYLTARFSAPMEIGGLETADPLDPRVIAWWAAKAGELYAEIPDFGGFLVKANSEGQPGPQNYGRSHREGANMLADALAPYGGNVIWRAFVYSEEDPDDRAKQAYTEFAPEDGKFRENVLLQVKNGPIDFQPREPVHPLFGAMPETPMLAEFQITKEYLGFATHLVYLPRLFEEVLQTDTYREGPGSTVARVVDGSLHDKPLSGMAGVANIVIVRYYTIVIFCNLNSFICAVHITNDNFIDPLRHAFKHPFNIIFFVLGVYHDGYGQ